MIASAVILGFANFNGARAMQTAPQASSAAPAKTPPASVTITQDERGVHVAWTGSVERDANGYPIASGWAQHTIGNARLPAFTFAALAPDGAAVEALVTALQSAGWDGLIETAPALRADRINEDGSVTESAEEIKPPAVLELPQSPFIITGDSHLRGQRVVAMALTPLYASRGQTLAASHIKLTIPNVKLFNAADLRWGTDQPGAAMAQPLAADTITAPPINPAALTTSVRITVTNEGIQRISGQALAEAGFSLPALALANAHVFYRGAEVAAQVVDGGTAGVFDATDEIRFFAVKPGDRWNTHEIYWLTFDTTPGLRMTSRSVTPTGAQPITQTGVEEGEWRAFNTHFEEFSTPDGDHFTGPRLNSVLTNTSVLITLTNVLPLAPGSMSVLGQNLIGDSYNSAGYTWTLQNTTTGEFLTYKTAGLGNVTAIFTTSNAVVFRYGLMGNGRRGYLDYATYARPVYLNFSNSGAIFWGYAGEFEYQLTNAPLDAWLYDISAAQTPVLLTRTTAASAAFRDARASAARYLLGGAGSVFSPALAKYTPRGLDQPLNAQAVYIAPAQFATALQPLLAHRMAQGASAVFVDVQGIYDGWSHGRVAPLAIRDFLRYTVKNWGVAPTSVVLVGDTTYDPLNYISSAKNIVPSFLLPTDTFLLEGSGEAPCDACLANLDGDYPVPAIQYNSADYLPDLDIGRFPVQNTTELATLVNKIIGYETNPDGNDAAWRATAGYLTDNYVCTGTITNPNDCVPGSGAYAGYVVDPAGNFFASAQDAIALQPSSITTKCNFFMPPNGPATSDPCYSRNDTDAKMRARNIYKEGALLTLYNGHGLWTGEAILGSFSNYMLNVTLTTGSNYANDVMLLDNGAELPVTLQMSCFTSKYNQPMPENNHHSLDEQLVLSGIGGSIATWGSTGKSVATGHDSLTDGFLTTLWGRSYQPTLGELTRQSRLDAYTNKPCCRDVLYSFSLLGDPLTRVRKVAASPYNQYLPVIGK